jgi:arylsulfatase A-like enzyme
MIRTRRGPAALVIALLLAVTMVTGCGGGSSKPNVIVIVMDTQRADRLGVYGYERATHFLDAMAKESVVWDRAYAPSSWTVPSIASLFLAQQPFEHRVAVVMAVLPDSSVTLAEELKKAGYRTGGFSANIEITAEAGFDQGFDTFRTIFKAPKDDAKKVNEAALLWLDEIGNAKDAPLFMYLQYMEPHSPYRDHPFITATEPPPLPGEWADYKLAERVNEGAFLLATGKPLPEPWKLTPPELGRLKALYDGEVTYLDRQIAAFLLELERRGLLENSIIVVTADHGEHLGEHGLLSHGNTLYEEVIKIPLIVRLPNKEHRRITEPVSITGLAPALLQEIGLPIPDTFEVPPIAIDGTPGSGYVLSEVLKVNPTYLRYHKRAIVGPTTKLLVEEDGTEVFIDLATDPGEDKPMKDAPFAGDLRKALADLTKGQDVVEPGPAAPIDEKTRDRLRQLGYAD